MKINLDDPRVTAFALGELTGDDAIEMARAVRSDERVRRAVDEARDMAHILGTALSPFGSEMLTPDQRAVIRSVGSSPVIEDIASAKVPFWKKPAVVATGVAAAVALMLYVVADKEVVDRSTLADQKMDWNWSKVDTQDLAAPVRVGILVPEVSGGNTDANARAVSAAISDDTEGFRRTLRKRIQTSSMKSVQDLPHLDTKDWQEVVLSERIPVPMSSGAASWPWIKRYVIDAGQLPPAKAVRIEEMVNHFSYRRPSWMKHKGMAADVEWCRNPWNPRTHLLALHVQALPGADVESLSTSLVIRSERIEKLRLLGYATAVSQPEAGNDGVSVGAPAVASRTRGNYVFYEILLNDDESDENFAPIVSLILGDDEQPLFDKMKSWSDVSSDMRFATIVAATGMMLADYSSMGDLNPDRLNSMVDSFVSQDGGDLSPERKQALELMRKASHLLKRSN